jgi:hypothetical protein
VVERALKLCPVISMMIKGKSMYNEFSRIRDQKQSWNLTLCDQDFATLENIA